MPTEGYAFEQWLRAAKVPPEQLNDHQRAVLNAMFRFLQNGDGDYSTSRIASHFLLHCGVDLDVAQIARLVGISPRSAFRHRKLSATQVGQQIQHHVSGRPYGKLLPRHAGPIAEFLFTHREATRNELLDFIDRTFKFRVSKVALWEFLKKYGLDRASLEEARQAAAQTAEEKPVIASLEAPSQEGRVPAVSDEFFLPRLSTRGPSCCGLKRALGSTRSRNASATNTVRSGKVS